MPSSSDRPVAAAAAAASRIAARRARAEDPDLAQLPDDLVSVAGYVHRYRRVAPAVLREDVLDALTILDYLRAELDRHRLATLRLGLAAGMKLSDLRNPLGVTTRQGVEATLRRLENAVAGGPKDEKRRRAETSGDRRQASWLAQNSSGLRAFAAQLVGCEQLHETAIAEDLEDLATDLATIPAGSPVSAGFAAELRGILRDIRLMGIAVPVDLRAAVEYATQLLAEDPGR